MQSLKDFLTTACIFFHSPSPRSKSPKPKVLFITSPLSKCPKPKVLFITYALECKNAVKEEDMLKKLNLIKKHW